MLLSTIVFVTFTEVREMLKRSFTTLRSMGFDNALALVQSMVQMACWT